MATLGSPLKISLTLGEWEEHACQWAPLHVERGFAAGQSVVTAIAVTGMTLLMDQTSRTAEQLAGSFAASILTSFSRRVAIATVPAGSYRQTHTPCCRVTMLLVQL